MSTCYNGKSGALSVNGTNVAQLTSWSITENVDTIECTHMGATWKDYVPGIREWEGSFEAIYDGADQGLASALATGSTVAIIAYPADGDSLHKFSGNAIITSIEHSADMEDVIRVSGSFTGTGALTVDTDASA